MEKVKKILLLTEETEFANDLADEFRLFFGAAEIVLTDDSECELIATVDYNDDSVTQTAHTALKFVGSDQQYDYTHSAQSTHGDILDIKRNKKRTMKISVFRALRKACPNAFIPWGSLTGIRPTRLLRELETSGSVDSAKQTMKNDFDVSDEKYALAKTIVDVQRGMIESAKPTDVDIYVGIPYCKTKCLYCSFPSGIRTEKTDMRKYIDALKHDIALGAETVHDSGFSVRCSYMGGGTPTVLTAQELDEVLTHVHNCYGTFGTEFTVEAGRPDTITREKLEVLKSHGVTRISINPQTMNDRTLGVIGRSHTCDELTQTYYMAKEFGFNINMDIILCLPGESKSDIAHTLDLIGAMNPENLTVHTLAIKRSSQLKQALEEYPLPDAETANSMVEYSYARAAEFSLRPYYMYRQKYMRGNLENVGYAREGRECVYNIDMMEETVSIMAHGAGTMTKRIFVDRSLRVERIPAPKDITTYINKVDVLAEEKRKLWISG